MSDAASWPPHRSRVVTTAALVAVNLIPVPLVLSGVWRSGDVLLAFWLENIAVGFWTAVQIATARGTPSSAGQDTAVRIRIGGQVSSYRDANTMPTAVLVGFLCFHYGMFTLLHGVFTLIIAGMAGGVTGSLWTWVLMLAAMVLSHGLSTAVHWFGRGERDRTTKSQAMMRPYGRIVVLQLAVIGGMFLMVSAAGGWRPGGELDLPGDVDPSVLPGLLLIVLKLVLDVATHLWRHRRTAEAVGTTEAVGSPTVPPPSRD